MILRISPTGRQLTFIRHPESDDQGSTFFFGKQEIWVYGDTQLPSKTLDVVKPFYYDRETVLRWSPVMNDKPGSYMGDKVVGNQMKRYQPGTYGLILAQQLDKQGNMWNFVLMEEGTRSLEVSSRFGEVSQPGWIREASSAQSAVTPKQKPSVKKAVKQQAPALEGGRLVNEFTGANQCLRSTGSNQVRLLPCSSDRVSNQWVPMTIQNSNFVNLKGQPSTSNQCLTLEGNGAIIMKRCNATSRGQMWAFTAWQDGDNDHTRLQNALSGEQRCLDVINDGVNNRVHMSECGNYSGQAWGE